MSGKIHDGLCLLKGNVAEERLVPAVGRLHVDEEDLCQDPAERTEPQEDRPADFARHDGLVGCLDVHGVVDRELAETGARHAFGKVRYAAPVATRMSQTILQLGSMPFSMVASTTIRPISVLRV